jgi:hypothetical protein
VVEDCYQLFKIERERVSFMDKRWDELDTIYTTPNFLIKKGTVIKIKVWMEGATEEFDRDTFRSFIDSWTYALGEKDIKPFKTLSFNAFENAFEAEIKFIRKNKDIDELKLFCQDVLDINNYFGVHFTKWETIFIEQD